MRYLLIMGALIITGCQLVERPQPLMKKPVPQDALERSAYYIQNNEARKALTDLESLAVNNDNPKVFYLTGRAYASIGELDNAIVYYQKTLQLQSDYHDAYTLLKELHRYRQIVLQEEIDHLKEKQAEFANTGRLDIEQIMYNLNQVYNKQTQVYLAQGKAFLLYDNPKKNISNFAELEAELRDVQDFIRERKQDYLKTKTKQKLSDPLYLSVLNMRSDITKKHIKNLLTQSAIERDNSNILKSIDYLKEANTQTSRFYENEDSNIQSLVRDDEVKQLSHEINKQLIATYEKSVDIYLENRQKFENLQQWQEVADQNRKIEENLENLLQIQIVNLLRFEKATIQDVQNHSSLIPLYSKLITSVPNSDKKGEYHLQLARCYAKEKNYLKAKEHAQLAKQSLGEYRVSDFLEDLNKKGY